MSVPEVQRWLAYARSDLDAGNALLRDPQHYPRQACFLAQQAAEKALKAILIFLEIRFSYTHDLDHLRETVPPGWRVKSAFPKLYSLSIWAVEAHYPGDAPDAVETDARTALELAEAVYQTVAAELQERLNPPPAPGT